MANTLRALCAFAIAAVLFTGAASAKDLIYGSWVAAKHGVNVAGLEPMFKDVEKDTKGAVKWQLLSGGQVVSARSTLANIRDRVVDAGLVIPVFTQKELATTNTIFDLQMAGTDEIAVTGASTEAVMLHCPGCLDEYKKHKVVFLAGYGVTPFRLMCASEITKAAELQGKKVRATGGPSYLFAAMKAITVNIPPNEGVEAMQRGAVDCSHGPHAWLKSYGFLDVAKHIIDYSFGFPRALGMFVMNRDAWNALTLEQKKIMLRHLPGASARATIVGYIGEDAEAKKEGLAKGIKFHKGGKDFDEVMAKYRIEERKRVVDGSKAVGVKDPEKVAAEFDKVLPKWEKLAKGINQDVDKFAAALQTEIYDKLDAAKM